MLELNDGSSGRLLDHKAAPGSEIKRCRIQDQTVAGRKNGKTLLYLYEARFLMPVTTGQSHPSRK